MIRSSSTSFLVPMPEHSAHAPNGELKEKERGSNSSKDSSQSWQAKCSLYVRSLSSPFASTKSKTTIPDANLKAFSIESVRRVLLSALAVKRSITTSMVCFSCFFSFGASDSCTTSPSIRAREYPCVIRSLNNSTNSPLRALTTGANT